MKTAVSLPEELFKQAEKTAARLGIPRSRLFAQALEEFIEHHRGDSVTKRLNELYLRETSRMDEDLIAQQEKVISGGDHLESW
jgi:metal-responsive CopG/Arc/MetJ family transcriptional regulator